MFGISLTPPGLFGGGSGSGTVILTRQAPEGGVVVALSSGDPATVTVPSAVAILEGSDRAAFPIATQTVSADRQVSISGSAQGASVSAPLQVWAVLPTFLSWFSDPGEPVGKGGFGRVTTATGTFAGGGTQTNVQFSVNGAQGDFWNLSFSPPPNGQLQVGRYEAAAPRDAIHAGMSIAGRGIACSTLSGVFEVREFILTTTQTSPSTTTTVLSRFDATFEQHCSNAAPALRGEIRYTAGAR
jgi:hypothetical protein